MAATGTFWVILYLRVVNSKTKLSYHTVRIPTMAQFLNTRHFTMLIPVKRYLATEKTICSPDLSTLPALLKNRNITTCFDDCTELNKIKSKYMSVPWHVPFEAAYQIAYCNI
mmetsp:Transcript_27486/g.39348  ORF Transcript_27486/g.39348 Transcript_27486/m.39348 type:complete len:112 (-) Transcript_27486:69-404(-)